MQITPLFVNKIDGTIYVLDFNYEVYEIEQDQLDDSEYITVDGSPVVASYNIQFFRFLVHSMKKEAEYVTAVQIADRLLKLDYNQWLEPRPILMDMARLWNEPGVEQLFEKHKEYYNTVGTPIVENTQYFNKQKIEINYKQLLSSGAVVDPKHLEFDAGRCYLKLFANCFDSETGRLNSPLYSIIGGLKPYMIPSNNRIIEFDTVAAEWRFLLGICSESDSTCKSNSYWHDLLLALNLTIEPKQLKTILYARIYGAGMKTICEKSGLSQEEISNIEERLWNLYPKVSEFLDSTNNHYYSKDSSVVFDHYNKEMFVEKHHVKLNYLIQSSLATHFQLFFSKLRKLTEQMEMKTKCLYTVHDSLIIDFCDEEKVAFLAAIKQTNNLMKPGFRFVLKT